ncbi:hypothetical protein BO221_14050 [Archangium sp. Cb G35]|nr:hypothetical protein BO221_14050 [Archangium sp. Cb G35]
MSTSAPAMCPLCWRIIPTFVPLGGDGSFVVMRRHRCVKDSMKRPVQRPSAGAAQGRLPAEP